MKILHRATFENETQPTVTEHYMKAKMNAALIVVALLAYWVSLCSAIAFYDPGMQRWLNRDPIAESGGVNLYEFVDDDPLEKCDFYGLDPNSGGYPPPAIPQPITPPSCVNSPSGCGAGNGPVIFLTSCSIGDVSPVTTYNESCPNGGTVKCWKWQRCVRGGIAPTKGSTSMPKPVGRWQNYHRCDSCACPPK